MSKCRWTRNSVDAALPLQHRHFDGQRLPVRLRTDLLLAWLRSTAPAKVANIESGRRSGRYENWSGGRKESGGRGQGIGHFVGWGSSASQTGPSRWNTSHRRSGLGRFRLRHHRPASTGRRPVRHLKTEPKLMPAGKHLQFYRVFYLLGNRRVRVITSMLIKVISAGTTSNLKEKVMQKTTLTTRSTLIAISSKHFPTTHILWFSSVLNPILERHKSKKNEKKEKSTTRKQCIQVLIKKRLVDNCYDWSNFLVP